MTPLVNTVASAKNVEEDAAVHTLEAPVTSRAESEAVMICFCSKLTDTHRSLNGVWV